MRNLLFLLMSFVITGNTFAKTIESVLYTLTEKGTENVIGKIIVKDLKKKGIEITVYGTNMAQGAHGFHLHEKKSLGPTTNNGKIVVAGQAGGHWDPDKTGTHKGPFGNGHRGDLEQVVVDNKGMLHSVQTNSRIMFKDVKNKSFMVHVHSDNYTDKPKLGGSGARMYGASF